MADVVESVRLMEQDEDNTIHRWRHFVDMVTRAELPRHRGRLVKSLGDGMLLEFKSVGDSVEVAVAMLARLDRANAGIPSDKHICLRIGIHLADVVIVDLDIFGHGVNVAARLASIGGPQEIIVSAAVRDQLGEGADVMLEDLGERRLKHFQRLLHIYRARPLWTRTVLANTAANSVAPGSAEKPTPLCETYRPRKWLRLLKRCVTAQVLHQIELQRARTLTAFEYVHVTLEHLRRRSHQGIPLAQAMPEVAVGTDKA